VLLAVTGSSVGEIAVFGLAAFVGAATIAEMLRGVRAQRRALGVSVGRATTAAIRRNRRLYGGLVAHLGLLIAVVGVSWSSFGDRAAEVTIAKDETAVVNGYALHFDNLASRTEPHRRVTVAYLSVSDAASGDEIVRLQPSLNFYPASSEPIGTPSLRVGTPWNGLRDLYTSLVAIDPATGAITVRFYANPGIGLLWFGGLVMALGGLAAAWPGGRRETPARPRLDAPATTGVEPEREEVQV